MEIYEADYERGCVKATVGTDETYATKTRAKIVYGNRRIDKYYDYTGKQGRSRGYIIEYIKQAMEAWPGCYWQGISE